MMIGDLLRSYRECECLLVKELASILGCSESLISRVENGKGVQEFKIYQNCGKLGRAR